MSPENLKIMLDRIYCQLIYFYMNLTSHFCPQNQYCVIYEDFFSAIMLTIKVQISPHLHGRLIHQYHDTVWTLSLE